METIILKIGGSVLTKKELETPELRTETAEAIGEILATHYDPEKTRLILIHGAGSFGHILAKRHALQDGTKDHPEKIPQALEVQESVSQLHSALMTLFQSYGLPVRSFPTHKHVLNDQGKISRIVTTALEDALDAKMIPLLSGDMIPDLTWGYSVCSGDGLAAELSRIFSAEKVFFASDVDGIYTRDPHLFPDAHLIKETSLQEILSGKINLKDSHNTDVTGGLSKKFSLFKNSPSIKNIYLFNGLVPENFSVVFQKKPSFGTRIHRKE